MAGPDNIDRIAKWAGGSYTSACGASVGIEASDPTRNAISVFPNPANDRVNVALSNDQIGSTMEFFDTTGRMVLVARIDHVPMSIDISELANGIYILDIGDHYRSRVEVLR